MGPGVDSCQYSNEHADSVKYGDFLTSRGTTRLWKMDLLHVPNTLAVFCVEKLEKYLINTKYTSNSHLIHRYSASEYPVYAYFTM